MGDTEDDANKEGEDLCTRIIVLASRYCILNPWGYRAFGGLVVKQYIGKNKSMDTLVKKTMNIIKSEYGSDILLKMIFECLTDMHENSIEGEYPAVHMSTLAKRLSQYLCFDRTVDWKAFITQLLDFGMESETHYKWLEPAVMPFIMRTKIAIRSKIKSKFLEKEYDCELDTVQRHYPDCYKDFQKFKIAFLKVLNKSRKLKPVSLIDAREMEFDEPDISPIKALGKQSKTVYDSEMDDSEIPAEDGTDAELLQDHEGGESMDYDERSQTSPRNNELF
jgi:hypothetical protein